MIMAGFILVKCLLAWGRGTALSPFELCFSHFNGSPIHHGRLALCVSGVEVIYYPAGNYCR